MRRSSDDFSPSDARLDAGLSPVSRGVVRRCTKTILAAATLFAIGTTMLFLGVRTLNEDSSRAISMLAIGGIRLGYAKSLLPKSNTHTERTQSHQLPSFLPGVYACVVLLGTYLGWSGYNYDILPSYDD
jgi:hypothetical protein